MGKKFRGQISQDKFCRKNFTSDRENFNRKKKKQQLTQVTPFACNRCGFYVEASILCSCDGDESLFWSLSSVEKVLILLAPLSMDVPSSFIVLVKR